MNTLMQSVRPLKLWERFGSVASAEQQAGVEKLLGEADAILGRIVETFPTYTLHDRTHAVNVAELMGAVVEPYLDRLSGLECAMLLLAAFWHDTGMAYSEDERKHIAREEAFAEFLRKDPEAQVELAGSDELPRDIAEWYCRWNHSDRVFHHLNRADKEWLTWDGVPFREELGNLCRSHNLPAGNLKDDALAPTDFLHEADLRFCAVVLRIADILDFDRTRSPEVIYRYLGLGRRATPREKASDVEWRKHLRSTGFKFPEPGRRVRHYPLGFTASPDEPAVEYDVRGFLDAIEEELLACQQVVGFCSERWRDAVLPGKILRDNIRSDNYRYGDYRFNLAQDEVLSLLMGENLYENPYTFVRELLQNAIDASRHREFDEHARGNRAFRAKPIVVSEWYDEDRNRWIRFDDYGMGMTEEIVRDFLLRVGRSYYNSPEFKAEQLRYQAGGEQFTPISRFGIGLLSCFISGDRVEISTRHAVHAKKQSESLRLSISGLHGFFTLQTGNHIPREMPGASGDGPGYRAEPGTSIAIRLDPREERGVLDLPALLWRYVLAPPVPVEFEGERVGGDPATLVDRPWMDGPIEIELNAVEMRPLVERLALSESEPIRVCIAPIDLTSNSPDAKLRGQLVAIAVAVETKSFATLEEQFDVTRFVRVDVEHGTLVLRAALNMSPQHLDWMASVPDVDPEEEDFPPHPGLEHLSRLKHAVDLSGHREVEVRLDRLWHRLPPAVRARLERQGPPAVLLAHNGITVGGSYDVFLWGGGIYWLRGMVALSDELRPDTSVSRDDLRELPWAATSALDLGFSRAARKVLGSGYNIPEGLLAHYTLPSQAPLSAFIEDPLLAAGGGWDEEQIFDSAEGLVSAAGIKLALGMTGSLRLARDYGYIRDGREFFRTGIRARSAREMVEMVILHRDFACRLRLMAETRADLYAVGIRESAVSAGELLFPPLYFVAFEQTSILRHIRYSFANADHPFSRWLLDAAPRMAQRCPGILKFLRENLIRDLGEDGSGVEMWAAELNAVLQRVTDLGGDIAPPRRLQITTGDVYLG